MTAVSAQCVALLSSLDCSLPLPLLGGSAALPACLTNRTKLIGRVKCSAFDVRPPRLPHSQHVRRRGALLLRDTRRVWLSLAVMSLIPSSSSITPALTPVALPAPPTSHRWLKSHELLELLTNPLSYHLAYSLHPPPSPPPPGTLLLYNKSTCRRWRLDHRQWRMPERHVKLKVKGVERMNAIYAQQLGGHAGADAAGMCRRGYWLLDRKDVVLVHYVSKEGGEAAAVDGDVVKEEQAMDERKDEHDTEVNSAAAPHWLQHSHEQETKEPPPPPLFQPLSPALSSPHRTLSVQPPSDAFMSLSSGLLSPAFASSASPSSSGSAMQLPSLPSDDVLSSSPALLDVAPVWDYACGGSAVLLCCSNGHLFDPRALHCLFDQQAVRVHPVASGVYRVIAPSMPQQHTPETGRPLSVLLSLTDGRVSTPAVEFQYRPAALATTQSHPSFPLPTLIHSPPLPSRTSSLTHAPPSLSACSTPRQSSASPHSSRTALPAGRELLSSLLSLLVSMERHLLLSSAASTVSFLSTFTLEDIQRLVLSHPSDDLLEGMLLSILQSLAPTATHSSTSSGLHSPSYAATPTASSSVNASSSTSPTLHRLLTLSDAQGRQLIHLCAALGYLHLLAFLLDTGISIHTPTASTSALTPLHLAVMGGEEEVVRAVLAMGGEERRLDGLGRSAVELARRLDKQRLVAVFKQVEEEEERESGWKWEEVEADDEDDSSTATKPLEHSQRPFLSPSHTFVPPPLPLTPTASLSPLSSYLSVSTVPPPLVAASSAAPSSVLSDAGLSSSFSRLTLSDIGIDTSELSLHLQSLHPQPASFASFVSHTLTHVRSWLYRRHYAALTLQAAARGMIVRRRQKRLRESAVVIQQAVRRRKERREASSTATGAAASAGGRFHHLVQDMQERVRRKRQEMEREASGGADGLTAHGKDGAVHDGGSGDGMDVTGSRIGSPALGGYGGSDDAGVGVVESLLPFSPLADGSNSVSQHWT